MTHRLTLREKLVSRIQLEGPITFREFMQSALYDPENGYYNTERLKIGPAGDYYTSSNVHAAFGAILANYFLEIWARRPLTLVEMGAGTGQLALDILTALRDEHQHVFPDTRYCIVETSPVMRTRQREKLAIFSQQVAWLDMDDLAPMEGIIFSNEFVDALPVHRIRFHKNSLEELYVTAPELPASSLDLGGLDSSDEEGRLVLAWAKPSIPRLTEYIRLMKVSLAEGQIIEVNLDAVDWLERLAGVLLAGFLITIDYGDIAAHLYAPDRPKGTLRCFYKHQLLDSPLERIGDQDLTASVNFTALMEYGKAAGFETVSYERQSAFLMRNGLIDRISAMHGGSGSVEDLKERLSLKNLFVPGGASDNFRVLIQRKR